MSNLTDYSSPYHKDRGGARGYLAVQRGNLRDIVPIISREGRPVSKPYDASPKDLITEYPADWLAFAGPPNSGSVEVIEADISTVTAAADKVLRVHDPEPWILHVELQSSPRSNPAEGLQWYNTLLRHRHSCRVRTVVVLLRKQADSPQLSGMYRDQFPGEPPYQEFRYQVVRLWQVPVNAILAGGLGTLPLAPLTDVAKEALPAVFRSMDERLAKETPREQAELLWATTYVLCGLRFVPDVLKQLFQGVHLVSILEDSSAYVLIQAHYGKKLLLRLGRKRFGAPDQATLTALDAIIDPERLERMAERLLEVNTWAELLATP